MTLSRTPHDWPEGVDPPVPRPVTCQTCGFELGPNVEPKPMCPGSREKTLNRRVGLKRSRGLNPVNRERRKRRRVDGDTGVKHTYGSYHRWIQTRPCWIRHHPDHDCGGGGSGHHVRHVGNGGKDPANEVPLCEPAHQELHRIGKGTWEGRYDVSLQRARWTLWDRFRQAHPERAEKLAGYTPARTANAGG